MYVCMHTFMYVCMYVCMYAHMYVCIHVCMYVCMYVCTYMLRPNYTYVCMYVCRCVHTYCVLINPPMHIWSCKHMGKNQNIFSSFRERGHITPPLVTTLKTCLFLFLHHFTWEIFIKYFDIFPHVNASKNIFRYFFQFVAN